MPKKCQEVEAKAVPMTPMRRFFCKFDLFRPVVALGKRGQDLPHTATKEGFLALATTSESPASSPTKAPSSSDDLRVPAGPRGPASGGYHARLAFQQHDQPLDAVVVTTLPCFPFCCHEDLLLMSRKQLIDVAVLFNSRLPLSTQIELSESIADAHIRHCIETLVGIVPDVPGAPKAIKSRAMDRKDEDVLDFLGDAHLDVIPSPPTSPLAMRVSRRRGFSLMASPPRLLERLEEEDEGDVFTNQRHVKKRKVSDVKAAPTRILYERQDMEMEITPARALALPSPGNLEMSSSSGPRDTPLSLRGIVPTRSQILKRVRDSDEGDHFSDSPKLDDRRLTTTKPLHRSMGKVSSKKVNEKRVRHFARPLGSPSSSISQRLRSASASSKFASLEERIAHGAEDGMRMDVS